VPVPAELHARLIKTAFAHRGAQLRRKVYQAAALAATVLVTLGLALGGYWQSRPNLDSYALATRTEIEHEHRQQAVQDWLIARNLPTRLPYEFNFRLCLFHGFEEIQDRNVPVVIFSLGRDQARVYYVRKDQFKTDDARFAKSSLCTVEVHPSADPDVVIVISYTTDRLDPFLLRGPIGPIT
jgi:hypothetical protein